MKFLKLIALILCFAMLLPALVACNRGDDEQVTTSAPETEAPTEAPTTEAPTTEEPTEAPTEELYDIESSFVSFIAYNQLAPGSKKLNSTMVLSGKLTVPEGWLDQVNALMLAIGDVEFSLYRWNGTYSKTVSAEPIKTKQYLKDEMPMYVAAGMCNMELNFEEGEAPAGTYLFTIKTVEGSSNYATIYTGKLWSTKLPKGYEHYADYGLSAYINGQKTAADAPQASYVYSKKVDKKDAEPLPFPTEKDDKGTAKVILLGGQSNAEGVSLVSALQSKVSAEKFAEYTSGYSNVKIAYQNVGGNVNHSKDFVGVKAGQATDVQYFGPELGIAEYLAKNFPDEKFYIIKYAKGGSILDTEWYNAKNEEALYLLEGLTQFTYESLAKIEEEGYTPKIVGFVWNQGESDAIDLPRSEKYYANLEGMVNYVREEFKDYASAKGIGFMDAAILGNLWSAYRNVNMHKQAFSLTSPINFYIETYKYEEITTIVENNDMAHYDAMGMIKLGNLYGELIAKMLG